jgi:hypothetical protein
MSTRRRTSLPRNALLRGSRGQEKASLTESWIVVLGINSLLWCLAIGGWIAAIHFFHWIH